MAIWCWVQDLKPFLKDIGTSRSHLLMKESNCDSLRFNSTMSRVEDWPCWGRFLAIFFLLVYICSGSLGIGTLFLSQLTLTFFSSTLSFFWLFGSKDIRLTSKGLSGTGIGRTNQNWSSTLLPLKRSSDKVWFVFKEGDIHRNKVFFARKTEAFISFLLRLWLTNMNDSLAPKNLKRNGKPNKVGKMFKKKALTS